MVPDDQPFELVGRIPQTRGAEAKQSTRTRRLISSWEPEGWNGLYSVTVKLFHWKDEVLFRVYMSFVLLSPTNVSGARIVEDFGGVSLGGVIDSGDDAR
jgi:hypothetical protein